jgi:polyferredoxin
MVPWAWKYLVYYFLVAAGLLLLFRGRTKRWPRILLLSLSFVVLGGVIVVFFPVLDRALGMHPSPMCSLGRLLQMAILRGVYPKMLIVSLSVILGLSLIGKKLFCGWACPLGSLQELVYKIPWIKKVPNLPFLLTNGIRIYLFLAFILGLSIYGVYLYGGINAFELMHWELDYFQVTLGIGLLLLVSLFYYRPYCYTVCPIGLVSWALERFALMGVRFMEEKCTSCQACVKTAPCPAIEPLIKGKKGWTPDCTSCGACLQACPEGAIQFGFKPK